MTEEPYESRGSSTVPRGRRGEIPLRYSITSNFKTKKRQPKTDNLNEKIKNYGVTEKPNE